MVQDAEPFLLVRRLDAPDALLPWLKRLDVSPPGRAIMKAKGSVVAVECRDVPMPLAQMLKQEALAVGADFATPKNAILLTDSHTHGLLIATRAQFARLMEKMSTQPLGGKELAARLVQCAEPPAHPPRIMGVLNLTPDSFHDGGKFSTTEAQHRRLEQLKEEGADVVDLGPASSRSGAATVDAQEQVRRLSTCLEHAVAVFGKNVSVDTPDPTVARYALEHGAGMVNDITAASDPSMLQTVAEHGAQLVLMHMLGTPQTMQENPHYEDVTLEVCRTLADRAQATVAAGIAPEKVWLDPGIGFGKTLDHNLMLLRELPALAGLGFPVVVGLSRKSLFKALGAGETTEERLTGSLVGAVGCFARGAAMVRVHDVLETKKALCTARALGMIPGT